MSRYSRFSPKMRRSKKYSCKNRGGVAREVSRRERDIPNTFTPTTFHSLSIEISNTLGQTTHPLSELGNLLSVETAPIQDIEREKKFAGKKISRLLHKIH